MLFNDWMLLYNVDDVQSLFYKDNFLWTLPMITADDTYFSGKGPAGDHVLRSRLIIESKVKRHLVPLVFVWKRPSCQVDARLTTIVYRENQSLAHVA